MKKEKPFFEQLHENDKPLSQVACFSEQRVSEENANSSHATMYQQTRIVSERT